eukprot:7504211-Pyramimonas_sp.AAC.1
MARDACDHSHWGLRCSSLWGHATPYWVALTHVVTVTEAFGGDPYGATKRCWGLRWSSLWGHEALYSRARMHVVTATGAF